VTVRLPGLLLLLCFADAALAHRLSPAFFGLNEIEADVYSAQWKVSVPGGLADTLEPQIPTGCAVDGAVRSYIVDDARLMHARIACDGPLPGRSFTVDGLALTDTDVLLRVDYLDGGSFTHRLVPEAPTVVIPEQPGALEVVRTYLVLGVEHILLGIDHLLFVLALLLLVKGWGRLVATITAFTLAHSITLAAATLGLVQVPSAPVEATIALSILFLATELARRRSLEPAAAAAMTASLAARFPWVVAFTFGLLHGFGFAGALSEIGLPADAIPLALLFFNLGVESGQLLFVAAVLGTGWLLRRATIALPDWAPQTTAYVIGSVSAYWVFERTILAL
jgi:hydrogenase/urease accessory protein HupE